MNTLLLGLGTLAGAGAVLALSARSAKAAGPTSYAPYQDGYGPHIPSYTPTDPTQGTPAWCSPPPPLPARYTGDMALLHPEFRGKIEEVLRRLEGRGFRPRVHTSWRSAAYQADLVRTWPPRSWTDFSYHNVVDECGHPKSLAVDIIDRRWAWGDKAASRGFWQALQEEAERLGLHSGNRWSGNKWDPAHVQAYSSGSGMLAQLRGGQVPTTLSYAGYSA